MKLIPDWKKVVTKAWSFHLMALVSILNILELLELVLPAMDGILPVAPGTFTALSLAVSVLAKIARLIKQKSVSGEDE
jgi:hypothetical protein